jgi:hypothetical protein
MCGYAGRLLTILLRNATSVPHQLSLDLRVVEKPSLVLEPGVSKSLHTRDWMTDVFFEDRNFMGSNSVRGAGIAAVLT